MGNINGSVIVSWDYDNNGKGIVLIGEKDPLGIQQRINIIDAKTDKDGLEALSGLGIDIFKETDLG